jgi:hypothetical protein
MNEETRASRVATAGLSNAFRQVSTERYALSHHALQAQRFLRRGYPPATAALLAGLAFSSSPETWRLGRE